MIDLSTKVVLVTGAATGIGRATAQYLHEAGAHVFGVGLDGDAGRAAFDGKSPRLTFLETDLTDTTAVNAAAAAVALHFPNLNTVVNCAGIYPTGKRVEDLSDAEWEQTIAVNLGSIFKVCRATLPLLRANGGGSVVNVASVHAEATVPGVPAYAASKAAVVGLTRQMALDYACDRIRVNSVLPGSVATRMTLPAMEAAGGAEALGLTYAENAIARIAQPCEIAAAIGFLISDEASFITGSALQVDGGLLSRLL
jgi:NAD(P)-dependent dehydrogenase (short-subunit alcohol dehydrogenase family)